MGIFGSVVVFWVLFLTAFLSASISLAYDNRTALAVSVTAMVVAFLVLVTEIVMAWMKG